MDGVSRGWAVLQVLPLLLVFLHAAHAQCQDDPPTLIDVDYMVKVDSGARSFFSYGDRPSTCRWLVTSDNSSARLLLSHVNISFTSTGSTGRACLHVFDLPTEGETLRGSVCTDNSSDLAVTSRDRVLEVVFQGPPESNVQFWVRTVSDDLRTDCNRVIDVSNSTYTYVETPNFPGPYPEGTRCWWRLRAPPGFRLQLESVNFDTRRGSICDILVVYDAGFDGVDARKLREHCGKYSFPPLWSSAGDLFLRFSNRYSSLADAFLLRARAVTDFPGENREYSLSDSDILTLDSPNHPNKYPSNYNCWWRVRTREGVKLRVYSMTLVHVPCSDSLSIYEGENSIVGRRLQGFCGDFRFLDVWSPSNVVYLKFNSGKDSSVGTGFRVNVEAVPQNRYDCSSNYDEVDMTDNAEVFVFSPGFPMNSSGQASCGRAFRTRRSDHVMRVDAVELAVGQRDRLTPARCDGDQSSLEIYSGSYHTGQQMAEWCGSEPPSPVFTQGPEVYIWLRPSWQSQSVSFQLRVQQVPASSVPRPAYKQGIPVGAIVGGFFGALAFVVIVVVACCYYHCNRKRDKPSRPQVEMLSGAILADTSDAMYPFRTEGARYRYPEGERRMTGDDVIAPAAETALNDAEEPQSYLPPAYPGRSDLPLAPASAPPAEEVRGGNPAGNPQEAPPPSYSEVVANIHLYQQAGSYV